MTTTLAEAPIGKYVRIHQLQSSPDVCYRLRELGFCENAMIRCTTNSDGTLICEVCNARIGINHRIAQDILVATIV